jgi:hypothetical protein
LARRNAAHCFMGGPKRRKQPERYAQYGPKIFCIFLKNAVDKNIEFNYNKLNFRGFL